MAHWSIIKKVWSLSLVPGTELLKPLEFPESYECLSLFIEPHSIISEFMLMKWPPGRPLDSFRMGAAHNRNQSHAKSVRIISPTLPPPLGRKEPLEMEFNRRQSMMKSIVPMSWNFSKNPETRRLRGLLSWWASGCAGRVTHSEKVRGLSVPNHHTHLALCIISIWLCPSHIL